MKSVVTDSIGMHADPSWRIGIVRSRYYKDEIDSLVEGATNALLTAGIPSDHIGVHDAFGSFEIPLIGSSLARKKSVDALIGIGIIVQGDTHHADLLAREVTRGIMDVSLHYGIPFAMGVLFVDSLEQARGRASIEDNRGREAAFSVLVSLQTVSGLGT